MSKPIYKPTKPYTEDINDLVEKGGVGSGIRGHMTPKQIADSKSKSPQKDSKIDTNKMIDYMVNAQDKSNDHEEDYDSDEQRAKYQKMSPEKLKEEYEEMKDYLEGGTPKEVQEDLDRQVAFEQKQDDEDKFKALADKRKEYTKWLSDKGNTQSFKNKMINELVKIDEAMAKIKAKHKPKNQDTKKSDMDSLADKLEKGGVGSGKRGHTTDHGNGAIMDKKSGKMVPTQEYYDNVSKQLMNYSGFSDVGGSFMSIKQVINAVSQITGHSPNSSSDMVRDLQRQGRLEQHGKVFMVMKKKS